MLIINALTYPFITCTGMVV